MSSVLRIGVVCLAAVAGIAATPAELPYTLVVLPPGGADYVEPVAINDRRQVVGYTVGAEGYPFVWQNGVFTPLPSPPGYLRALPEDINLFGDIAGIASLPDEFSTPRAMIWRRGQPIVLGMFPNGFISMALAINDWGLVVGLADDGVTNQATMWVNGAPRMLGALPSTTGFPYSEASDVNNLGQVVGRSQVDSVNWHAVLWQRGQMIDLGTLPGDTHSQAYAINDRGQIVGVSANVPASTERPFIWENGVMREFGVVTGDVYARAQDINLFGVAVGVSGVTSPHAAIFSRGRSARLPVPAGELLSSATEMNNFGDAIGTVWDETGLHGVIWLRRP
jgi:probable HAF family extracellular repeat protein